MNARCGAGIEHLSGLSQNMLVMGKASFEDELAEKATFGSHHSNHVRFATGQKWGLTSRPLISQTKIGEDNILLPHQEKAGINTVDTSMYPPR